MNPIMLKITPEKDYKVELEKQLKKATPIFTKAHQESETAAEASYMIADELTQTSKPFWMESRDFISR